MKKLFLLLAMVGMIFTACQSGGDVEEDNGGTPFVPEITISPKDLTFGCNGGEQAVDITANFEYEVVERASWLTVEQTDEGLLVVVEANKNTSERSAFISITNSQYDINKSIEIYQEAWVPKIELAQQRVEVEFEPAEYEVGVTSPYSWEATTKNDWIVVESETGIAGEEVLRFSTKRNEEEKERKGTITLKNTDYNLVAELYVTQKAFVPAITIEPETLTFAVEGGTQEIAITANFEYEYSANADWLTIEKSEKGLKVTASNHTEVEERSAEITISNEKYGVSKVVNVMQRAFVPAITIEPETLTFAVEGGTQEVAVTANFEEYEASANADWLTVEKSEKGITVTVQNYVEVEERTAEITISSEKYGISKVVKVTQGAFVPAITIEPETLAFAVEGGTQEVAITTNFEYEFSTEVNWLTIKKSDKGVNITATPNAKFEERTAEITISSEKYSTSKNISVTQKGVSAESQNVIIYTSSDGNIVTPYDSSVFGANIVSNTYRDGQGIIIFDTPITSIGESAFLYCSSLTSVTIPDSVTSIGYYAFYGCSCLTSITIPDSVTWIGYEAFYKCSSLTSVTIPDSVTSIGNGAFSRCTGLTSITIPNSVTSIGERAFAYCSSLTSVTIPDSVTSIGGWAFENCSSLTSITIPDSVTSIGGWAFENCSSLTSITIGNGVTSIGESAFENCSSLTSVTIPDSVTSIGENAFSGCTGELTINCNIPSASSSYYGAFYNAKFTKVTIGNSVTSIGQYAFSGCTSLKSVTIGKGVTSIGYYAFYGCTGELTVNCNIPSNAFKNSNFTKVTIGNSVTKIGDYAFYGCSSLTSVTIPDSVTSIGDRAFYNCRSLTSVIIGNGVTSIGEAAFRYCDSLTSVTIPDSVTSIGNYAFSGCSSLISVYCKPTTPPAGGGYFMFDDNAPGRKIYVPHESVYAYKTAKYWSDYADDIVGYDFQ